MANKNYSEKETNNLIPLNRRSKEERHAIATKGGQARAKQKKEQKTTRELLNILVGEKIKGNKQFLKVAKVVGIEDKKSVKELYTLACLLNSIKKCDLKDLEILERLLGEREQNENNDVLAKLDAVIGGVDDLAE